MFHDNAAQVGKKQIMHVFKEIHLSAPAKTQLSGCACLYNKNVAVKMKKKIRLKIIKLDNYAPSKDSDQLILQCSLLRVFDDTQ